MPVTGYIAFAAGSIRNTSSSGWPAGISVTFTSGEPDSWVASSKPETSRLRRSGLRAVTRRSGSGPLTDDADLLEVTNRLRIGIDDQNSRLGERRQDLVGELGVVVCEA